jgi:hypothetical protein
MYVYAIYWIKDTFQAYIFYTWQDANSHCPPHRLMVEEIQRLP